MPTELSSDYLDRHIVLVGFMGVGKSSLARLTAERLSRQWYDSDHLVVERAGRSVASFFEQEEEQEFRRLERLVIADVLAREPSILSLGGGAFEDPDTRTAVCQLGFVVHLEMDWPELLAELPKLRLTRPLLQNRTDGEIHELFLRRQTTYREAHMRIRAPRGELSVVVDQLLKRLSG